MHGLQGEGGGLVVLVGRHLQDHLVVDLQHDATAQVVLGQRRVQLGGKPMELGPREWTVLEYLLMQAPKPAAKDKLLAALTGWDKEITPNAIEVYVSRLRAKLEPAGVLLRSIRGFGYRLELAAPADHVADL